jgi:hypothetical protein
VTVTRGYYQSQPDGLPGFLQDETSRNWAGAEGYAKDSLVELGIKSTKCRFITECPVDVLPYQGTERLLDRYAGQSDSDYRSILQHAFETWAIGDTPTGILEQLALAGIQGVSIHDNGQWAGLPPGHNRITGAQYAPGAEYWRFWISIDDRAFHAFVASSNWGTGSWGAKNWGFSTMPANWPAIPAIVKKHKPADSVCAGIQVILSGSVWESTRHWGDGSTWGGNVVKVSMGYQ